MGYRIATIFLLAAFLTPHFGWTQNESVEKASKSAEQELVAIRATLEDYIEGSTNGQPERLKSAFHSDLNLYSVRDGRLKIWAGEDYIADTKQGKPTGETGEILAIDYENDTAVAKVKITPRRGTPFIDYFMLLKFEEKWTIVHKMYTRMNRSSASEGRWRQASRPDDQATQGKVDSKNASSHVSNFEMPTSVPTKPQSSMAMQGGDWSDQLNVVAKECLSEQHLPGLAIVVVKDGKTILKRGYGLADVERKIPVDPDRTLFRIGSISKALTFLTLSRLIDDGRIKRSDPVEKYIGQISNPYNLTSSITINHLLTHTAGFDQIGTDRHIFQHELSLDERKNLRPGLVDFLSRENLRRVSEAGEMYRYDTYGTTLAGAVIAKVTGKTYAAAMKEEMFDTLGMQQTSVEATTERLPHLAKGYGWREETYQVQPYEVYVTTPASSIDGTISDMGRLLEALTSNGSNKNGRLFSREMNEKVLSPQFRVHPEFSGVTHGLIESHTSDEAGIELHSRTVGHGGAMRGYRAAMTLVPDQNIGVFIVANRSPEAGGGNVDFTPLLRVVLESIADGPTRTAYPVPDPANVELEQYVGEYYYGVYCHLVTPDDLSRNAWRRGRPRQVSRTDNGLKIGDEVYVPRERDLFVQANGRRMVFFSRNAKGEISAFTYSTSPDTFERESLERPYPEIQSLAQETFDLFNSAGLDEATKFFLQNRESENYYVSEAEMNRVGYILLESDEDQAALEVFKLNVNQFPKSSNVYDSLGDAYSRLDNLQLAKWNYEKSLELNPHNETTKRKIESLGKAK